MAIVTFGVTISQSSLSQTASPRYPIYSEPFCIKTFEEVVEKARITTWKISDRDRHILTQCRLKFRPQIDTSSSLPTGSQCLDLVKTLVQEGIRKLKELEIPEEQARSISRCDEVLKYYNLASDAMLPTLKPRDRLVVDTNIYKLQMPDRGDIIVFNPNSSQSENLTALPIGRAIGLPGETVRIANGILYINGTPIREKYLNSADLPDESKIVPANSYFILGDNHHHTRDSKDHSFVSHEAIIGKVIWHFSDK